MKINIIGAGMAGLLAANILRRHNPTVIEAKDSLPDNHSAVLRFRNTSISDATGIPFKKVLVRKAIWDGNQIVNQCNVRLANLYSAKVTKDVGSRSIWNLEPEHRWIAPRDFITQMANSVDIRFGQKASLFEKASDQLTISTMPMPTLMTALGNSCIPEFPVQPISTLRARIATPKISVHQTVYNPAPYSNSDMDFWYRATIHGDEVIIESVTGGWLSDEVMEKTAIHEILSRVFGIQCDPTDIHNVRAAKQPYGKIFPIDERLRQQFIVWASDTFNIFSLGRFATWRPLLLDDLVSDVKVIENLILNPSKYGQKLSTTKLQQQAMKVELINYTGQYAPNPSQQAATLLIFIKNTRLEMNSNTLADIAGWPQHTRDAELTYIANTLRSSWEFIDYTFCITGVTRAFTHQFVRTRTGSYAQQTHRTLNVEGFTAETPETIGDDPAKKKEWDDTIDRIRIGYSSLIDLGVPTQDARGILPTNVHTNIVAKFNLRTLADLVGKRENLRAQGEYQKVARAMALEALNVHPWLRPFLYPERKATPQLDKMLKEAIGEATPASLPVINLALKELDKLKSTWG